MARNLAKAGHIVRAWNRSSRPEDGSEGVYIVPDPTAALQADAVFTMLSDDAAIRDVLIVPQLLQQAKAGMVHVVNSTISVDFSDELRVLHAKLGIDYVAAPVFGRPDVAEAGQLNIVAAGEAAALAKVQPLLAAIGRKTFVLGTDPKQANAAKIAGNMMIALAIESMAEALALTSGNGVEPDAFIDLMTQTLFSGRAYENYGSKIVKGDYEAGFRMQLGLKDLRLATEAADKSGKTLPLLQAVRAQMSAAVDAGLGDKDWSALAQYTLQKV